MEGSNPIAGPEPWNCLLAFMYDMYDSRYPSISIGVELGRLVNKPEGILTRPMEGPTFEDVDVSAGEVVCMLVSVEEGQEFRGGTVDPPIRYTLLVRMESDERIKVEIFEGNVSDPEFTSNAMYYTR